MRKLILGTLAVVILGAPIGQAVRADDTTVIKRDKGEEVQPLLRSETKLPHCLFLIPRKERQS
jgi:hypothetical protein